MSDMIATRAAYGSALVELGRQNKDIVVLDADLSCSTNTLKFAKEFPDRFFNVGVAEQNLMGTAAGLAASGKIAFASTFAIFATGRAYDQIRNTIAYSQLNVNIGASHGGITVGEDGSTHQSLEDIGLMRGIPDMKVFVPVDAVETKQIVFAVPDIKGPTYIRTGRPKVPVVFGDDYTFTVGKAATMRDGSDITIIANSVMVEQAMKAADSLKAENINVRVLNMSTVKPIDKDAILKAASETGAIVTAEEHSIYNGLGSAVAEVLVENKLVPMKRIGVQDMFGCSGKSSELMEKYCLTAPNIVNAVKDVMARKK